MNKLLLEKCLFFVLSCVLWAKCERPVEFDDFDDMYDFGPYSHEVSQEHSHSHESKGTRRHSHSEEHETSMEGDLKPDGDRGPAGSIAPLPCHAHKHKVKRRVRPKTPPKWNTQLLKWYLGSGVGNFSWTTTKGITQRAFEMWSEATGLKFVQVLVPTEAHIKITAFKHKHGDCRPFDGRGGVVGHAFLPPPVGGVFAGEIHLDSNEAWVYSRGFDANIVDVLTVMAHEIGHVLGLGHTKDKHALMHKMYTKNMDKLHTSDLNAIRTLYPPMSNKAGCDLKLCLILDTRKDNIELVKETVRTIFNTDQHNTQFCIGKITRRRDVRILHHLDDPKNLDLILGAIERARDTDPNIGDSFLSTRETLKDSKGIRRIVLFAVGRPFKKFASTVRQLLKSGVDIIPVALSRKIYLKSLFHRSATPILTGTNNIPDALNRCD